MRVFQYKDEKKYQSFLHCLRASRSEDFSLDYETISEFLIFGSCYFDRTLVREIKKVFRHQKFTLDINNGFIEDSFNDEDPLVSKTIKNPVQEFLSFFKKRAHHLKDKRISIDLTGGIDSRLIAVVLKYLDVPFDAVFSLDSGTKEEAELVSKVAKSLGVKIDFLQSKTKINRKELNELFELSDGLWDFTKLISLKNTQQWRQQNGYDLVITGVGGELYKDFWWQQDFPFYNRKYTNLDKLISMRMYPQNFDISILEGKLKEAYLNYFKSFTGKLEKYIGVSNSNSYDKIYHDVRIKEQISIISWMTSKYIDTYSPLLEHSLLSIGFNLPKRKRLFNNFHREIISGLNPQVSKIPTTEGGMSVSNNAAYKSLDILKYGMVKTKKLSRKLISDKRSDRKFPRTSNSIIVEELKNSLKYLKKRGLINLDCKESDIPKNMIGRLLVLHRIVDITEN